MLTAMLTASRVGGKRSPEPGLRSSQRLGHLLCGQAWGAQGRVRGGGRVEVSR